MTISTILLKIAIYLVWSKPFFSISFHTVFKLGGLLYHASTRALDASDINSNLPIPATKVSISSRSSSQILWSALAAQIPTANAVTKKFSRTSIVRRIFAISSRSFSNLIALRASASCSPFCFACLAFLSFFFLFFSSTHYSACGCTSCTCTSSQSTSSSQRAS